MAIADPRKKVLFLPVIRGNYPAALTVSVKAAVRRAADAMGVDGILPPDDAFTEGVIRTDDDVRGYHELWRPHLADIRALIVFSGDFMCERAVQDTARLLPEDTPTFLIVNNDRPDEMREGEAGDSLCGSLSVSHNLRMLGRSLVGTTRIDMHDETRLRDHLERICRVSSGIEAMRNTRVATIGVNPSDFATTFANQIKLFELGISLHPYELLDLWGDVVLGRQLDEGAEVKHELLGSVRLRWPIYRSDPRVAEVKEKLREAVPVLPDEGRVDLIARCFLWVQDLFERDHIDAGAIHCWAEHPRYFGFAPCAYAMLANRLLRKPLVCEVDACHAVMAKLGWEMTDEAPVILDINNNGWDPRVFNVFHCSQTPPNWLTGPTEVGDWGSIHGQVAPGPFTGVSAATSADAFHATVFHGHVLAMPAPPRGSSGWTYVPNLPAVLSAVENAGIHHFVAMKGHVGADVVDALTFRGLEVVDLCTDVPEPDPDVLSFPGKQPAR